MQKVFETVQKVESVVRIDEAGVSDVTLLESRKFLPVFGEE
jgi:hypothetical protein